MLDKLVVKLLTLKMRLSDDHGQDLVEYALLTGGIGLVLIAAVAVFTGVIGDWFNSAATAFGTITP